MYRAVSPNDGILPLQTNLKYRGLPLLTHSKIQSPSTASSFLHCHLSALQQEPRQQGQRMESKESRCISHLPGEFKALESSSRSINANLIRERLADPRRLAPPVFAPLHYSLRQQPRWLLSDPLPPSPEAAAARSRPVPAGALAARAWELLLPRHTRTLGDPGITPAPVSAALGSCRRCGWSCPGPGLRVTRATTTVSAWRPAAAARPLKAIA